MENETKVINFHEELKLTFDALRNTGLAASLLVAARYAMEMPELTLNISFVRDVSVLVLCMVSLALHVANCYSYLKMTEVRRKSKIGLVYTMAVFVYIFLMSLIFLSIAIHQYASVSSE